DDLLEHGPGPREDGADPGKGQRNRPEELVPRPAVHAASAPSIDDEGPAERLTEDRRSERDRIPTVDDAQRGPVSGDEASRDGVEDDAGAGGCVALPCEVDEGPEGQPLEQTRVEARDRHAELIERSLADAERPSRLDVIPRDAATARDDEEFHAHRNVSQQAGETSKIPCVVVSGNEDGTAEGNDDFLHVN